MTRKDYVLIASVINGLAPEKSYYESQIELEAREEQWRLTVDYFAHSLESKNSNFNRDLFMKACGIED